jgi:zinc transporter ZupT
MVPPQQLLPPKTCQSEQPYRRCTAAAGMMVYITIKELIPTALRYDPQDSVVSTCVILGMVVMAGSLLLFTI